MAEAAARAEDCLLTHCQALQQGVRLGIDAGSKTITALPLLLPNYMPSQAGLPSLLAELAQILQQPGGAQDVEGIAEVGNVQNLRVQKCAPSFTRDLQADNIYVQLTYMRCWCYSCLDGLQALAAFYAPEESGETENQDWQVDLLFTT